MTANANEILVVGCLIWQDDKFLALQRQDWKPEPGMWGIPAGKVDPGEDELQALARELQEETGLTFQPEDFVRHHDGVWEVSGRQIRFHTYRADMPPDQSITLEQKEHKAYAWMNPDDSCQREDMIHKNWLCEVLAKI